MIWAAIHDSQRVSLAEIKGTLDSDRYQALLGANLVPYPLSQDTEIIFQQDNAPPHARHSTKIWMAQQQIQTVSWPALSADLNPIENLWSLLVRRIYEGNKVYPNKGTLLEATDIEVLMAQQVDSGRKGSRRKEKLFV